MWSTGPQVTWSMRWQLNGSWDGYLLDFWPVACQSNVLTELLLIVPSTTQISLGLLQALLQRRNSNQNCQCSHNENTQTNPQFFISDNYGCHNMRGQHQTIIKTNFEQIQHIKCEHRETSLFMFFGRYALSLRQRRRCTFEQLKSCFRHERDDILLSELQHLVSSAPKHLQGVVKRGCDAARAKHAPIPTLFVCLFYVLLASNSKRAYIFQKPIKFLSSNIWYIVICSIFN